MQGFYIALAGSVLGSAVAFSVLRLLFRQRIREWSSQNEKWQALESVVASRLPHLPIAGEITEYPFFHAPIPGPSSS